MATTYERLDLKPSEARYGQRYVWELPVRISHWTNVLCIPTLFATGLYIASPQLSPGRTFIGKNYRFIAAEAYNVAPTAYDLHLLYPAKYGTILAAKQISVLVKHINITTGAAGTPSAGSAVVS